MTTTPTVSSSPAKTWRTVLVGTPLGWVITLALAALGIYLFATHPDNFARTFVEGVVGSTVAAWLTAVLFVPVYNRMIGR